MMKVTSPLGLSFSFSQAGALQSIDAGPTRISLTQASPFARRAANLFLRKRESHAYTALLGPQSPSRFQASGERAFDAKGHWEGLDYVCRLELAASALAWTWRVQVVSALDRPVELDLIYVQDVGLKGASAGLVNEAYVSQYLERRVFEHPRHGSVLCCRQNMREAGRNPWLMIASADRASAASTDGLQLYGTSFRATFEPEALAASALQGELSAESSVVAIQEQPWMLGAGESRTCAFVASYLPDHPEASSEADLRALPQLVVSFAQAALAEEPAAPEPPVTALVPAAPDAARFLRAPLLQAEDLTRAELEELFGRRWRHIEEAQGHLLSFFCAHEDAPFAGGPRHVVLRAKELQVERPHGHIMQANAGLSPEEGVMSTTAFACGVFNSHLTQGNTNFNTLLSVCTQPTTPDLEGQRVLVELEDGEHLLGVPSAFEMGLNHCRWIYKRGSRCIQVCTWTSPRAPLVHLEVQVLRGGPVRLALTQQFDELNGWAIRAAAPGEFIATPRADSMLATRFPQAQFRLLVNGPNDALRAQHVQSIFVLEVPRATAFSMSFVGEVAQPAGAARAEAPDARRKRDSEDATAAFRALSRSLSLRGPRDIAAIDEVLPWFASNALVHYLTPYGLEQFSGAAWGTRDVCQGPIDLLLSQEKLAEAKQVLRILFSRQDPDGGWPQWWMFDRYDTVRADSAHGDVIYWCILALSSYLRVSSDFAFLDERLPFFAGAGAAETASVCEHVDRIIQLVKRSFVPGTALVRFGGGDWNDSLQPVSEELAQRMISSWTVQMSYQAFDEYGEVCERAGRAEAARELRELAARILADFHRHLMPDGVVAGYGLVQSEGPEAQAPDIEVLLHPTDARTGVHYSLLPMNRGVISGTFTQEQAEQHLALIARHLEGPDGARLMDRPLRYHGGLQKIFQRAESSTYFGREIGLMYVHEHLRYAESLARMGRAEALLRALRQAIPVDYRDVVPQGNLRQANCYYSSSDVLFRSRYEADERYAEVTKGALPLTGGWRVYSSGPGIYVAHVITRLLGLRVAFGELILDPVLARSLDGLSASLHFHQRAVTFVYRVEGQGFGPRAVIINGVPATFEREPNPYRLGGATMPLARFLSLLDARENTVELRL